VREAANLALDRKTINDALYLGLGRESSSIIPHAMRYYREPPAYHYDPARARQLLAAAGYKDGFDGGDLNAENGDFSEMVQSYLAEVGIRVKLRLSERASHLKRLGDKSVDGLAMTGSGAAGNAATRLEQFVRTDGAMSYLHEPALDALIDRQAMETDDAKRIVMLDQVQQQLHDGHYFMPVLEYAMVIVVGPRMGFDGVNAIPGSPYTTPYEDLSLKPQATP
jgi:ABC-type transport system substrate-binding protein